MNESIQEICSRLQCQHHHQEISLLNLEINIPIGKRALCSSCDGEGSTLKGCDQILKNKLSAYKEILQKMDKQLAQSKQFKQKPLYDLDSIQKNFSPTFCKLQELINNKQNCLKFIQELANILSLKDQLQSEIQNLEMICEELSGSTLLNNQCQIENNLDKQQEQVKDKVQQQVPNIKVDINNDNKKISLIQQSVQSQQSVQKQQQTNLQKQDKQINQKKFDYLEQENDQSSNLKNKVDPHQCQITSYVKVGLLQNKNMESLSFITNNGQFTIGHSNSLFFGKTLRVQHRSDAKKVFSQKMRYYDLNSNSTLVAFLDNKIDEIAILSLESLTVVKIFKLQNGKVSEILFLNEFRILVRSNLQSYLETIYDISKDLPKVILERQEKVESVVSISSCNCYYGYLYISGLVEIWSNDNIMQQQFRLFTNITYRKEELKFKFSYNQQLLTVQISRSVFLYEILNKKEVKLKNKIDFGPDESLNMMTPNLHYVGYKKLRKIQNWEQNFLTYGICLKEIDSGEEIEVSNEGPIEGITFSANMKYMCVLFQFGFLQFFEMN